MISPFKCHTVLKLDHGSIIFNVYHQDIIKAHNMTHVSELVSFMDCGLQLLDR